jgi:hypothetical protein
VAGFGLQNRHIFKIPIFFPEFELQQAGDGDPRRKNVCRSAHLASAPNLFFEANAAKEAASFLSPCLSHFSVAYKGGTGNKFTCFLKNACNLKLPVF